MCIRDRVHLDLTDGGLAAVLHELGLVHAGHLAVLVVGDALRLQTLLELCLLYTSQQLAAFADERKLCRGRAGVHTEEAAARIACQVSLLHHRPRVARAERVVVLL